MTHFGSTWQDRLAAYPLNRCAVASSNPLKPAHVAYRQNAFNAGGGKVTAYVLLHGIGSASASWLGQLDAAAQDGRARVLAWDAPGYGQSDALPEPQPNAALYAARLWAWLDALHVAATGSGEHIILVGHSLGCLMAASAACLAPERVARLILLSPAQGYARAPEQERNKKRDDRLQMLAQLGPRGMSKTRGAAMLSANASPAQIQQVQETMAAIHPAGYSQATHMLAGGDLLSELSAVRCPVRVASGSADTITPPAACEAVARHANAPYVSLPGAGHACTVEAPDAVNPIIFQPEGLT
jgi:pimeloyl-ACP methyl ester carboxylesterase